MNENLLVLPKKLVDGCFLFISSLENTFGEFQTVDVIKQLRADTNGQCLGEIFGTKIPVYVSRLSANIYFTCRILHIVIIIAAFFLGWKAWLALLVTGASELFMPQRASWCSVVWEIPASKREER